LVDVQGMSSAVSSLPALLPRLSAVLTARSRRLVYITVAALCFVMSIYLAAMNAELSGGPINLIVSDGRGYYVYLPSLMFDNDLDFANQVRERWDDEFDPWYLTLVTPKGQVAGLYSAGMAMSLSPAFVAAHALSVPLHAFTGSAAFAPDGYSMLYQVLCCAWICILGCCAMTMLDDVLATLLELDPRAVLGGVLALWIGTHYLWYYMLEPFMVHIVSSFWICAIVWISMRLMRQADAGRLRTLELFALLFAASMAVVCRPTRGDRAPRTPAAGGRRWSAGQMVELLKRLPLALPGILPGLLQMCAWKWQSGQWIYYSYQGYGFKYWNDPALWQTLFSTRNGLFVWAPTLLFALGGIAWWLRTRQPAGRAVIIALCIAACILWYANSSWHCWWFGWACGGRAFLEAAPLFAIGFGCFFHFALTASPQVRRLCLHGFLLAVAWTYMVMILYRAKIIPPESTWF
jgi:hypothetical protein